MSDENPFANWPHMNKSGSNGRAAPQGDRSPFVAPLRDDSMASSNALERFLGGSPSSVFVKLLFISLVVGALLMWLDIRPIDIFNGVDAFIRRIYALGFGAVRELANYVLAGAAIVVPAWLILRLLQLGGRG